MKDDQAKYLRRSLEHQDKINKGHTIAVVSGKGGVGKSNISVNFSLELMNQQKKVLLIDLDVGMGNIDILLGLNAKYTIVDMIKQRMSIDKIIEKGPNDISYIAGGKSLEQMFSLTKNDADYFLKEYEYIQQSYDFIIFDLGAGVSQDSMFFILAADECFVVTTPEPTSITDAYGMIKHIVKLNDTLPIYLILNRITSNKRGQKTMERFQKIVQQFLNYHLTPLGYLPEDHRVMQAVIRQTPLILTNSRSPMVKGIRQMTRHYLVEKEGEAEKAKPSFIERFKQLLTKR